MRDLLLAVDVGTSGVKAAIFDSSGRALRSAHEACILLRPQRGQVVQPVEPTRHATLRAICAAVSGDGKRVRAVVVSSQRATFVPLDVGLNPLSEWISWQDHRGVEQCGHLSDTIGSEAFFQITGLPIEPTAAISKIMWLGEHEPDISSRTFQFASHQGLVLRQLGAERIISSYSDAAYLGLFDITANTWSSQLCAIAGIEPDQLGTAVPSGALAGVVSSEVAALTGLIAGTPLVVGGGDLQCGALGVGAVRPGVMTVGLGTGGHCVAYVDRPTFPAGHPVSCQPHVLPNAWEMEGIAMSTGSTFAWAAETFGNVSGPAGPPDWERLIAQAAGVAPGSDGLLVLPMLNGAGSPDWDPTMAGTVFGLRLQHGRSEILRAFIEGICFELKRIKESMETSIGAVHEIRLWGGPARSAFWSQLVADIFGVAVQAEVAPHTGPLGASILAAVTSEMYATHDEACAAMVTAGHPHEPVPSRVDVYQQGFARYGDAMRSLQSSGFYGT